MSNFYLAPSLVALRDEINARFPKRDKTSDGWIGDTSHQARPSDHNPDWGDGGVVRAIDIDIDDGDHKADLVAEVLKAVIGDPRVWYVIFNRKIYSRTYGWKARAYTGSNPHDKHIHVSIQHSKEAESNTSRWLDSPVKVKPVTLSNHIVVNEFRRFLNGERPTKRGHVARVQRLLNMRYKAGLTVDGIVGAKTVEAWEVHERKIKHIVGRPDVPDEAALVALSLGEYRVTK